MIRRLALLFGIGALLAGAIATPARAADATPSLDSQFSDFYKDPSAERVALILKQSDAQLAAHPENAAAPLVGFLAASLVRYPTDVDRMIPPGLSAHARGVVAAALKLAGQRDRAEALREQLRAETGSAPALDAVPESLDAVVAGSPSDFDLLWGASFASGDPKYCLKIVARFAAVANADGNAEDMLTIARTIGTGADARWLVDKRGRATAVELINVSTALWSLNSNARRHEFVASALNGYMRAHPGEPATTALQRIAGDYDSYDIGTIVVLSPPGASDRTITFDLIRWDQLLDDLERHAGRYPAQFSTDAERQRAAHDVQAISDALEVLPNAIGKQSPLLLRAARLNAIGHNLDLKECAQRAMRQFRALLALAPEDAQANYAYGHFLATTTLQKSAIAPLEKAKRLGQIDATYWLGFCYAVRGDKQRAIENLELWIKHAPDDQGATELLEAVREGKVHIHKGPPPAI